MIRNVVLDMGNVILDFNPERYLAAFVERDEDRALLRKELFGSIEWVMTDHGVLDNAGLCRAVCARIPERLHESVRSILAHWFEDMPALPGVGDVIGRLLDKGYRLYVLSNVGENFDIMKKNIPHIERFSGTFISSEWKLIKPEPAIFSAFCAHFRLVPAECLFVDDQKVNVYGAVRIGMKGLPYYGDPADIEKKLEELNGSEVPGGNTDGK